MKTKILIFLTLLVAAFTTSCEKYEGPYQANEFSDFCFIRSDQLYSWNTSYKYIDRGRCVTFMDMSQNAVDHAWIISDGCYFLDTNNPDCVEDTDEVVDLTPYIINKGDNISKETTVRVLFNETGTKRVQLQNTFKDSITFNYAGVSSESETNILYPTYLEESGLWLMDTILEVEVIEPLGLNYTVYTKNEDGSINEDQCFTYDEVSGNTVDTLNWASWTDKMTVCAGDSIFFRVNEIYGVPAYDNFAAACTNVVVASTGGSVTSNPYATTSDVDPTLSQLIYRYDYAWNNYTVVFNNTTLEEGDSGEPYHFTRLTVRRASEDYYDDVESDGSDLETIEITTSTDVFIAPIRINVSKPTNQTFNIMEKWKPTIQGDSIIIYTDAQISSAISSDQRTRFSIWSEDTSDDVTKYAIRSAIRSTSSADEKSRHSFILRVMKDEDVQNDDATTGDYEMYDLENLLTRGEKLYVEYYSPVDVYEGMDLDGLPSSVVVDNFGRALNDVQISTTNMITHSYFNNDVEGATWESYIYPTTCSMFYEVADVGYYQTSSVFQAGYIGQRCALMRSDATANATGFYIRSTSSQVYAPTYGMTYKLSARVYIPDGSTVPPNLELWLTYGTSKSAGDIGEVEYTDFSATYEDTTNQWIDVSGEFTCYQTIDSTSTAVDIVVRVMSDAGCKGVNMYVDDIQLIEVEDTTI
ncbi:MAG: hypothetical protein SNG47_02405 [Rikenellaceae bacterium]